MKRQDLDFRDVADIPQDRRRRGAFRFAAAALLLALLAWGWFDVRNRAVSRLQDTGLDRTDLSVYTDAARAMLRGDDPYAIRNSRGWTYLYPPLAALLFAPLSAMNPPDAAYVWFLISLVLAVGAVAECVRVNRGTLAEWLGRDPGFLGLRYDRGLPAWIGLLAFAAAFAPAMNCFQRGQVGFLVSYPLLLGFRLAWCARSGVAGFAGGVLLAFATVLKITPALPAATVGALLALRPGRPNGRSGASFLLMRPVLPCLGGFVVGLAAFALVIPAAAVGWDANWRNLHTWTRDVALNDQLGEREGIVRHSARNQSLENAFFHAANFWARNIGGERTSFPDARRISPSIAFPVEPTRVRSPARIGTISLLALLAACIWLLGRGDATATPIAGTPDPVPQGFREGQGPPNGPGPRRSPQMRFDALNAPALFGLACALSLLASPISWGHHYVLLLPAVSFVSLRVAVAFRRTALALAAAAAMLVVLHYALLDWAGYIGLLGIGMTVWFTVASFLIVALNDRARRHAPGRGPTERERA